MAEAPYFFVATGISGGCGGDQIIVPQYLLVKIGSSGEVKDYL